MKFLVLVVVMCIANVSYGQFETVPINTFETVKTLETIEAPNFILAQVDICEFCSLVPISIEMHMEHKKPAQRILFRGNREGRLRALIARLLGRDRRSSRRGCG